MGKDREMKKLISIVAPMYNEEKLAHEYCKEMLAMMQDLRDQYEFELLLVNDGSKDDTYAIMLDEQRMHPEEISTICLSRNFGLEGAVNAGIRKASGDAVVVMDADLQDPPEVIPEMIKKWENGADIVVGSRISRNSDGFFKKLGANTYYRMLHLFSGKLKLEKSAANFRLLSRKAIEQVLEMKEANSVFRVVVPYIGMKTDIVGYDRDKRFAGKTKYNLKSMVPYALDSITGISVEPLRKIVYFLPMMVLLFGISLFGGVFAAGIWRDVCVVAMVMSVFNFFLFLALTIMAEYMAQIMIEVKGRPMSIIYQYYPCENARKKVQDKSSLLNHS